MMRKMARWLSAGHLLCAVLFGTVAVLGATCGPAKPTPEVKIIVNPPRSEIETGAKAALTVKAGGTSDDFKWSASRGRLSPSTGPAVIYTAPQISGSDTVTVEVGSGTEMVTALYVFEVSPALSPALTLTTTSEPDPTTTPEPTSIIPSGHLTYTLTLKPLKEGEVLQYKLYLKGPDGQETELQELVDTRQYWVAPGEYELAIVSDCYHSIPRQEVDIQAGVPAEVDFSSVVGWLSFSPPEGTTEQRYRLYNGGGLYLLSDGCTPIVGLGQGDYKVQPYYPYIGVEREVVVTGGEETPLDWAQFNREKVGALAFKVSESTGEPRFSIYDDSGNRLSAIKGTSSFIGDFSTSGRYWLMPKTYQRVVFQSPYLGVVVENLRISAGEEETIDLEQIAGSLTLRLPEDAPPLDFSIYRAADGAIELARVSDGQTGSRYWLSPGTYDIRLNSLYIGHVQEIAIQAGQDTALDLTGLSSSDFVPLTLRSLKEGEELKYKLYLKGPGGQETELQELVDTEQYWLAPGEYELELVSDCYYNVPRQEVDIQAGEPAEVDFSSVVGWLSFSPPQGITEQRYRLYTGAGGWLSGDGCTPTVGLGVGVYKIYPYHPYIGVEREVVVTSGEETALDWAQFNAEELSTLTFKISEATGEPQFSIYDASGNQIYARTGSSSTDSSFSTSGRYWLMPGIYQKVVFHSPYLGVIMENLRISAGEEKEIGLEQIAGSLTLRLPEDSSPLDFSIYRAAGSETEVARVSDGQTGSRYWLSPGAYEIRLNSLYIGHVQEIAIQAGQDIALDLS